MEDKEIKRMLKDAGLWLNDAGKAWPKYREITFIRIEAALNIVRDVMDYVERPMGGKETEHE
jgi:hypothetical protein